MLAHPAVVRARVARSVSRDRATKTWTADAAQLRCPAEPSRPNRRLGSFRFAGGRRAVVAAGAAMATGGAVGAGAAVDRATRDEPGRRGVLARGETAVDRGAAAPPGAATSPRPVRGQRVGGAYGRARSRFGLSRGAEASASASSTAESVSEGNVLFGARALRAARSPSIGGWCSRRSRCSTTWSCTSSVTCASRITRGGSGRSSSDTVRTGGSSAIGCASTALNCWHSDRKADPAEHATGPRPTA